MVLLVQTVNCSTVKRNAESKRSEEQHQVEYKGFIEESVAFDLE